MAFSHGQIQSKIWLCEKLEPYLPKNANVAILGSWYNILGFMLLSRNQYKYNLITGIDIDKEVKSIANNITNAWQCMSDQKILNITADANEINLDTYDTIINCSPEHMSTNDWFHNIPENKLVCIQSSDVNSMSDEWLVCNPNNSLDEFIHKYPLSKYMFMGTKEINYDDWGYKRFMVIGIK
jgi:hypothetical protein